jgi:hypothetical protein
MDIAYVPPLDPKDIPKDCYAKWDDVNKVWEFPLLSTLNPPMALDIEPTTP